MGSLTSPCGSASGLRPHGQRICLLTALRPYPGTTTARYSYPLASPLQLAYRGTGSAPPLGPKASGQGVSITRFSMDDPARVREYQPVVHRLRLSASP